MNTVPERHSPLHDTAEQEIAESAIWHAKDQSMPLPAGLTNYHYCRAGKLAAVVTVPNEASLEFAHNHLFTIPEVS